MNIGIYKKEKSVEQRINERNALNTLKRFRSGVKGYCQNCWSMLKVFTYSGELSYYECKKC